VKKKYRSLRAYSDTYTGKIREQIDSIGKEVSRGSVNSDVKVVKKDG